MQVQQCIKKKMFGGKDFSHCPLFLFIERAIFTVWIKLGKLDTFILLGIKLDIGILLGIKLGNRHYTRHKTWHMHKTRQSAFVRGN